MSLQNWVLWATVGVVGCVAVYGATNRPAIVDGTKVDVNAIAEAVLSEVEGNLGSASSPSVVDGCMEVNGVSLCTFSQKFSAASTTCSFRNRGVASSTLIKATARVLNPQGSTLAFEFGKAATAFATTTSLGYYTGITGGTTIQASTTVTSFTDAAYNFTSTDFLNIKAGSTTFSGTGVCTAMFMSI